MIKQELKTILDDITKDAIDELEKTKGLNGILLHVYEDIPTGELRAFTIRIGPLLRNDLTKKMMRELSENVILFNLKKKGHDIKLYAVCMVSECFISKQKLTEEETAAGKEDKSKREHPRPSQDPNRTEALIASIHLVDKNLIILYPFSRDAEDKVIFEPLDNVEIQEQEDDGSMTALFPSSLKEQHEKQA